MIDNDGALWIIDCDDIKENEASTAETSNSEIWEYLKHGEQINENLQFNAQ